jgi:hypothetical protein
MKSIQTQRNVLPGRLWQRMVVCCISLAIGLAASGLLAADDESKVQSSAAPSAGGKSVEEKLKAVERERDDLKRRNAELEQRLKQVQASVDDQVHQALAEPQSPRAYAFPPQGGNFSRRMSGPFVSQFRPMFPPFSGIPDPVELAISYSDALGEKDAARPALDAARQKVDLGRGGTALDVDAASARLSAAQRKVRLLRNIVTTARRVAAEDFERMRKLGAVRAVSVAEVRNAEARLKILEDILAMDSDATTSKPVNSPPAREPK